MGVRSPAHEAGPGAAHLGMFRKTRHWGFRSWILEVRSVPSHWRQSRDIQAAIREGLAHPTQLGGNDLLLCSPQ